jgi:lactate dehydrogenase-like 2-hydroxyacid dehydrogenase
MPTEKPDVLLVGSKKPIFMSGLPGHVNLHVLFDAPDRDAFINSIAGKVRGAVIAGHGSTKIDSAFMQKFPKLEMISNFGVGYDHIDAKWAGAHRITVTNTPDVLNEEVADTTLGLLLCTVRELPQAERYLRAGKWPNAHYRLTKTTLRDRTVGLVGMGRIGRAIAKRLDAFGVPVVYHSRNPQNGVSYKYYPKLVEMARDVDTLVVIVPGGAATQHLINKTVMEALGPNGILINIARGSVVDEKALIAALKNKTIYAAGLDVFADEPNVPAELIAMENVVLFPHVGSASIYTRDAMDQLVVDNIVAWANGNAPISPVAETPWSPKR